MTSYRIGVALDLAANYSAKDGSALEPRITQALLTAHKRIVEQAEQAEDEPWEAACRIALSEGLPYLGHGDDIEEQDKPKRLLIANAMPPKRALKPKAKPKSGPPPHKHAVVIELSKPQALILANSAVEALKRGLVDDHKHRTLQRALAVVREATRPAKEAT